MGSVSILSQHHSVLYPDVQIQDTGVFESHTTSTGVGRDLNDHQARAAIVRVATSADQRRGRPASFSISDFMPATHTGTSYQHSEVIQEYFADISRLASHKDGWDGHKAIGPTRESIAVTMKLIQASWQAPIKNLRNLPVPTAVLPLADGGAQLEWESACTSIEVEIDPSGTLHYLLSENGECVFVTPDGEFASFAEVVDAVNYVSAKED